MLAVSGLGLETASAQYRYTDDRVPYFDRGYTVPVVPAPGYVRPYRGRWVIDPPPFSIPSGYAPWRRDYRESYRPVFPAPPRYIRGDIVAEADSLLAQVDTFLQAFSPTADIVPEGERFLRDAHFLRDSAVRFRELAARGADPSRLSRELRGVEEAWSRLSLRTDRIARGRYGPNIRRIDLMGQTIAQLRSMVPTHFG
jgi:hypothetical protein